MPAKAPVDENVKFLFACIFRSDYKTIDFTRVAADFSINPAAARMRWSRLKKTINPDDIASTVILPPPKPRTRSPARPKREQRDIVGVIAREVKKEKRVERKAKVRAEQKIGIVVKNEGMAEEEEGEIGASTGVQDEGSGDKNDEGQTKVERSDITTLQTEEGQIDEGNIQSHTQAPQPAFGLFHLSPSAPSTLAPAYVPRLAPDSDSAAPEINDETDTEPWGATITVKHEPEASTNAAISLAFARSPDSSSSCYSPASSTRTSASPPPQNMKQSDRAGRVRKTRGRPRKMSTI